MLANLELSLTTEREVYEPGEPVSLVLTLRDTGTVPEVVAFRSGQRYDFVVTQAGREIWRWSAGRVFTQFFGGITVAPGETLIYAEIWRQVDSRQSQVPPGEYSVEGFLTADGALMTSGLVRIVIRSDNN